MTETIEVYVKKENSNTTAAKSARHNHSGSNAQASILRLPAVKAKVAMSRSWIYANVKAGTFPKPVNVGSKAVGWLTDEIETYIKSCSANRAGVPVQPEVKQ